MRHHHHSFPPEEAISWSSRHILAAVAALILCSTTMWTDVNGQRQACSFPRDCAAQGQKCVGARGECSLPFGWSGPLPVKCNRHRHCKTMVGSDSKCRSVKQGLCYHRSEVCKHENLWVRECPSQMSCSPFRRCVEDQEETDWGTCSVQNPCFSGRTCCSDGRCSLSRSCSCSRSKPLGSCPLGQQCGRGGTCSSIQCFSSDVCPSGFVCTNRNCQRATIDTTEPIEFGCSDDRDCPAGQSCNSKKRSCSPARCSSDSECPFGFGCRNKRCKAVETQVQCNSNLDCLTGEICRNGECRAKRNECNTDLDCSSGRECQKNKCRKSCGVGGECQQCSRDLDCPREKTCKSGTCVSHRPVPCDANHWDGVCADPKKVCRNGVCVSRDRQCSARNPRGFCPPGEECVQGECHVKEMDNKRCSASDSCPRGQICERSRCRVVCSQFEPSGFCPDGRKCIGGLCVRQQSCNVNRDCPYRHKCGKDRLCHPAGQCTPENPDGFCENSGEECSTGGRCVKRCHHQCRFGQVCDENRGECVDEEDGEQRCSIFNSKSCPEGRICKRGRCVPKRFLGHHDGAIHIPGLLPGGVTISLG